MESYTGAMATKIGTPRLRCPRPRSSGRNEVEANLLRR